MANTSWQRLETIGPNGEFITVNDSKYGFISGFTYQAPAQITKPMIVIVRGNRSQLLVEGNSINFLADGPLGQVTQIIQLLPGTQKKNPDIYNNYTPPDPVTEKKEKPPPKPVKPRLKPNNNKF